MNHQPLTATFRKGAGTSSRFSKALAWVAGVWFAVVIGGSLLMAKYAQTPGGATVPPVGVQGDGEGAEARRFHAETSGTTVLYDGGGKLRFGGGITASRGHEGDNAGSAAVALVAAALDEEGSGETAGTPVFGCALCE